MSNNLLQLVEGLKKSFPSLGLHKGNLDSACLSIVLINTNQKIESLTDQRSHFTSLKLRKCSQIPHSSPSVVSTANRTKTNHHCLTIYKYSTHTKLRHLARGKSDGRFSNFQVFQQKKILDSPPLFSLINTRIILAELINKRFGFSRPFFPHSTTPLPLTVKAPPQNKNHQNNAFCLPLIGFSHRAQNIRNGKQISILS